MASCWFQQFHAIRLSAHNCLVHMQIHRHMTDGSNIIEIIWLICIKVTGLPRKSTCFYAQLKICTSYRTSLQAFVLLSFQRTNSWESLTNRGIRERPVLTVRMGSERCWRTRTARETKSWKYVPCPIEAEYLRVLFMEEQEPGGCKNFSSQGKT